MKVAVLYSPGQPCHGWCLGDVDAVPWPGYITIIVEWNGPSAHPAMDRYDTIKEEWRFNDDKAAIEAKDNQLTDQDREVGLRIKMAKAGELGYADLVEQYNKELTGAVDRRGMRPW